jgi:hypothetical protein
MTIFSPDKRSLGRQQSGQQVVHVINYRFDNSVAHHLLTALRSARRAQTGRKNGH